MPDLREGGAPLVANLGAWRYAWDNAWATEETLVGHWWAPGATGGPLVGHWWEPTPWSS